jgi:hypothetical protein
MRLDGDYLDHIGETPKVVGVAGVHRDAGCAGRGGHEQVHRSSLAGLAPFCDTAG